MLWVQGKSLPWAANDLLLFKGNSGYQQGKLNPSCPSALILSNSGVPPLLIALGLCHPPRQLSVSVGDVKKQNNTLTVYQFWKIETGFIFCSFDVLSISCKDLPFFCFDWQDLSSIFGHPTSPVIEGRGVYPEQTSTTHCDFLKPWVSVSAPKEELGPSRSGKCLSTLWLHFSCGKVQELGWQVRDRNYEISLEMLHGLNGNDLGAFNKCSAHCHLDIQVLSGNDKDPVTIAWDYVFNAFEASYHFEFKFNHN